MQQSTRVHIALGSNLGDRRRNIASALERLSSTPGVKVGRISRLYQTEAVGGPDDSPPFLNGAAELETTIPAPQLLGVLLGIEAALGRQRHARWGPRLIDLDLLLYGQEIHSSQALVVPHPLMHERLFVLEPLAEIAPDVVHPTLRMTIAGLRDHLLTCSTERRD